MKANINPRTGTKIIKKYKSRTRHNPFVGLRMAYPTLYVVMQLSQISVCPSFLLVCLFGVRKSPTEGRILWVVKVYRRNKCDKHSTILQIQTAPNKSPAYLHGNSNCMNKCVSQVGKNVDSYEYYQ
jgi:hypothetical protein